MMSFENATVVSVELRVHPLTTDLWPKIEDLFESGSACKRCWCMYWRIGSAYRQRSAEVNKAAFYGIVQEGPPPGLLAFDGDTAVGWCQLSSRDSLPWLGRTPNLKRVDDLPVWCISCFYVRKGYRKQGVTSTLIRAALNAARKAGVPALEAYPLDGDLTSSSSFTGFASTFLELGFKPVARRASSTDHASYVGDVTRVIQFLPGRPALHHAAPLAKIHPSGVVANAWSARMIRSENQRVIMQR